MKKIKTEKKILKETGPYVLIENLKSPKTVTGATYYDVPSGKALDEFIRIDIALYDVQIRRFLNKNNPENSTPDQLKSAIYILSQRLKHLSQQMSLIAAVSDLKMPRAGDSPEEKVIRERYEKEHPLPDGQ